MSSADPVLRARGRLAQRSRGPAADPEKIAEARRELAVAKIEKYVQRTLSDAPRLSPAQAGDLARLILSASVR